MNLGRTRKVFYAATLLGIFATGVLPRQISQAPVEPQTLIRSLEGPDLFRAYCATCHGPNGKGGATAKTVTNAPDLTLLTKRNGGMFPADRVREIITGDKVIASHGSRQMPIWGPIFHQVEADQDRGNIRMKNLVTYLESIQSMTLLPPPTGAELYQKYCTACHGSDLKGGPPMPAPYRVPPDLTTLAKRHGGTYPESYVESVLREGVVLPAHGPAEMPIWGMEFRMEDNLEQAQVRQRIHNLAEYIRLHQAKQ